MSNSPAKRLLIAAIIPALFLFAHPVSAATDQGRIWSTGFENNTLTAGVEITSTGGTGTKTIVTSPVHSGTYAMQTSGAGSSVAWASYRFSDTGSTGPFYFRFYVYVADYPDTTEDVIELTGTGGTNRDGIRMTSAGKLQLMDLDGTPSQVGSDSATLNLNTWYRVEIKYDATAGFSAVSLDARIDGVSFASSSAVVNGGNIGVAQWGMDTATTNYNIYWDDIAINTLAFPGPGNIVYLRPNAAGDNTQWTLGAGTGSNYQLVNESSPDDATSYVRDTATTGLITDDYNINDISSAIGSGATINLVQVGMRGGGNGTTARTCVLRLKAVSAGTVSESTSLDLSLNGWVTNSDADTTHNYQLTSYVKPGTSSDWTPADIDNAQIGVRHDALNANEVRESAIWLLVDYVPQSVAGATKFVFANVPASSTAGGGATFNVEAVNASGSIDTSFQQDVTLTVSGSASGGGLVAIINGVGTSTVSDNVAETVNLGLQDTQGTGLDVSATSSIVFAAGPVSQFALNDPGNMNAGTRLGYTVSRKDQYGNPVSSGSTVVYLYSTSTSTNKAFYNAASGGTQISSTTISNGNTSANFWYYDDTIGTKTITVSDNPSSPDGNTGVDDASDNVSVTSGAVKFVFANVPASANAGQNATFNVEAIDSFGNVDATFQQDVTLTTSGSATGGGLVDIINGIGTSTVSDAVAETVDLGLLDTQSTGLNVNATSSIVFSSVPVTPPGAAATGAAQNLAGKGILPAIDITFSGWAYPGASVSVIRKDLGLAQAPVGEKFSAASDGSFLIQLNHVTRLEGQTYLLSFADKDGRIAQTKAYNVPARDKLMLGNIVVAPTLGFESQSTVTKGGVIVVTGYATPKGTVEFFVDGKSAGKVTVNDPSGKYRYSVYTGGIATGRHSVYAVQTYSGSVFAVGSYTDPLSSDEVFADGSTLNKLFSKSASGAYAFVPGPSYVSVSGPYPKTASSDFSNQRSFAVSPLKNPRLDMNGDGAIDIKDMSIFLSYLKNLGADIFRFKNVDKDIINALDYNSDGVLDIRDLSILLANIRSGG